MNFIFERTLDTDEAIFFSVQSIGRISYVIVYTPVSHIPAISNILTKSAGSSDVR